MALSCRSSKAILGFLKDKTDIGCGVGPAMWLLSMSMLESYNMQPMSVSDKFIKSVLASEHILILDWPQFLKKKKYIWRNILKRWHVFFSYLIYLILNKVTSDQHCIHTTAKCHPWSSCRAFSFCTCDLAVKSIQNRMNMYVVKRGLTSSCHNAWLMFECRQIKAKFSSHIHALESDWSRLALSRRKDEPTLWNSHTRISLR